MIGPFGEEAPVLMPIAGGQAAVHSAARPDRRGRNEDCCAVLPVGDDAAVLVVADGCGGHAGGERASRLAVECLAARVAEAPDRESLRGAILDGFEEANRAVLALGVGAGTTLVVVEINSGTARTYHAGDSVALVVGQRGRRRLETLSHAPVAHAVEAGLLDEAEALHHEDRTIISNLIGVSDMRVEIGSPLALAPRDTVVLATDGVTDNLELRELVDLVRAGPLEHCARQVVEACRLRMTAVEPGRPSHPDDATFVLYRQEAPRGTIRSSV